MIIIVNVALWIGMRRIIWQNSTCCCSLCAIYRWETMDDWLALCVETVTLSCLQQMPKLVNSSHTTWPIQSVSTFKSMQRAKVLVSSEQWSRVLWRAFLHYSSDLISRWFISSDLRHGTQMLVLGKLEPEQHVFLKNWLREVKLESRLQYIYIDRSTRLQYI
jgi:hypothetical protein